MDTKKLIGPLKEKSYKDAGEAYEFIAIALKTRYNVDLKQPVSYGIAQKSFAKNAKTLKVVLKDLFWDDACNKMK